MDKITPILLIRISKVLWLRILFFLGIQDSVHHVEREKASDNKMCDHSILVVSFVMLSVIFSSKIKIKIKSFFFQFSTFHASTEFEKKNRNKKNESQKMRFYEIKSKQFVTQYKKNNKSNDL